MIKKVWLVVGAIVIVAIGVAAFLSYGNAPSGTPAQRLSSWVSSTELGQKIGTLEGDAAHVQRALAAKDGMSAVHTVCAAMANDAQTANDELPAPDGDVTQLLARAYGLEYDAAESCYGAASPGSSLMDASMRDRKKAKKIFNQVLQRVAVRTGKEVPTTTTTVPDLTGTSLL